jgi:putative CocE/NonD family hydrolase
MFLKRIAAPLLAVMLGMVLPGARSRAGAWSPEPARYGAGVSENVPVTMADGTVLRADVNYPTEADGSPATGPFPVILTQTPYGKSGGGFSAGGGASRYLVTRGYIHVVADVRGTGGSEGSFGLFDPVQAQDGVALVRWSAALSHSDGTVGLLGLSYLGINQFFTAAAIGPGSPVKAIFPIVAANDPYRDTAFEGGLIDSEFGPAYLGLTAVLNTANPVFEHRREPAALPGTLTGHVAGLATWQAASTIDIASGGDLAYDGPYWQERNPGRLLDRIVANDIAVFLVGGWHDLFQRGAPLNYSGLQNAAAGRPVWAPMAADQAASGRYQLLMGPWYHGNVGAGLGLDSIELAWFDTWLKGETTGITDTPTPFHAYDMGTRRWMDVARYPFEAAKPTTLYLGDGGRLTAAAPASTAGADPIVFTPISNPCRASTDQWGAGGTALLSPESPCSSGSPMATQAGPGVLQYTSEPLPEESTVAGPIGVTLFATSTRPETEWVADLEDVDLGGTARPLTSGALLGSFRALDPVRTWTAPDGKPILAYHPSTRAQAKPVVPGEMTRYDIEVFPTLATLPAGHRVRLTLTTADTPHLTPTAPRFLDLLGGVYSVARQAGAASFVEIPLAPAGALARPCGICR